MKSKTKTHFRYKIFTLALMLFVGLSASIVSAASLDVSLSNDTPRGTNIPYDSPAIPFTTIELTAGNGSDVKISSLIFTRLGLGEKTDFSSAWLEVNGFKAGISSSINNAQEEVKLSFNPPIVIPSGQTVLADLVAQLSGNKNIGSHNRFVLASNSDIGTSASVNGNFPIEGEEMEIADYQTTKLRFATLGADTNVGVGQEGVEIGQFSLSNASSTNKDVELRSIKFKSMGTAKLGTDLKNLALHAGGFQVSANTIVSGDTVTFVVDNGITGGYIIEDGKSITFSLKGDTAPATDGKTINFRVESSNDIIGSEIGTSFGVNTVADNGFYLKAYQFEPGASGASSHLGGGNVLEVESTAIKIPQKIAKGADFTQVMEINLSAVTAPVKVEEIWLAVDTPAPLEYVSVTGLYKSGTKYLRSSKSADGLFGHTYRLKFPSHIDVKPGQDVTVEVTANFQNSFRDPNVDDIWKVFHIKSSADKGIVNGEVIESTDKAFINEHQYQVYHNKGGEILYSTPEKPVPDSAVLINKRPNFRGNTSIKSPKPVSSVENTIIGDPDAKEAAQEAQKEKEERYRALQDGRTNKVKIFSDLDTSHKNHKAVEYLKTKKIIQGYEDGSFKPTKTVNRAEMLKILVAGKGLNPDSSQYSNCFPDVGTEWFAPFVCYAKAQGWVKGYPDGTFGPAKSVSKVESLKMLLESYGYDTSQVDQNPYSDVDKAHWFAPYVKLAKEKGLLEETGSSFSPGAEHLRAGVSENLYRLLWMREQKQNRFE